MATTTRLALPYPTSAGAVAVHTDIQALADRLDLITTPKYVTSLPGSPADGDEIFLMVNTTNGIIWHLRYRSASASAYKWEFVGGPDWYASSITSGNQNLTTTIAFTRTLSAGDLSTLTVPAAGEYQVQIVGTGSASGAAALYIGAANSVETLNTDTVPSYHYTATANTGITIYSARLVTAAAAQSIGPVYAGALGTGTGTSTWIHRRIMIRPIRLG